MDVDKFLDLLWSQRPSGEAGFEGLTRKLLERLTGQRFYLALSGRQYGRDLASPGRAGNALSVECKRYKDSTDLGSDELLAKFASAVYSDTRPDLWMVVTTRRLGEQLHADLKRFGEETGVAYHSIDAAGGMASPLLALCTAAPEVVVEHFQSNGPHLSASQAEQLRLFLRQLFQNPEVARALDSLRAELQAENIGYGDWCRRQHEWLAQRLEKPDLSKAAFAQDLAVRAEDRLLVPRRAAQQALGDWWGRWSNDGRGFAMLGEEGDGKTWAVAEWLSDKLREDGFPPVVFLSCPQVDSTDPLMLVAQALRRQLSEPYDGYWKRRVERWLARAIDTHPAFMLVFDGLNERAGLAWPMLLASLTAEPWTGRVAIVVTCRLSFWERHLGGYDPALEACTLGPYDESELAYALAKRGLRPEDFASNLRALLSKPRYFDLMLRLRAQMAEHGDVTVERLVYEDWRDRRGRKPGLTGPLSHQDFQELMTSLARREYPDSAMSRSQLHQELQAYGDGAQLLEELASGSVLRRDGSRWVVDRRYLILGFGLLLAEEVKQAAGACDAAVGEVIAAHLEPQADMDLKVSICGMALYQSLLLEDFPDRARLALFRAWLAGRNISSEDWRRVPAYLPLRPEAYVAMAEHLWSAATDNREAQSAFMAGFLRFRPLPRVQELLLPTLERWMGFVYLSGWQGRHARNDRDREQGRNFVRRALGSDQETGVIELFGFRLELTTDEGLLRLARTALAIISHQERGPHLRAITTGVLAGAVTWQSGWENTLPWVLLTSPDSIEADLLAAAQDLMAAEQPTALRAAWSLLTRLDTPEALTLRAQIPVGHEFRGSRWQIEQHHDPCSSIFRAWTRENYLRCLETSRFDLKGVAQMLSHIACEPRLEVPERFVQRLETAGADIVLEKVQSVMGQTGEDLDLEILEPTLCAFRPQRMVELWRSLALQLSQRFGGPRFWLAWKIYEHLLVLGNEEHEALMAAWRAALSRSTEDDYECHAETILFSCVLWGRPIAECLELINERGTMDEYCTDNVPCIGVIDDASMPLAGAALARLNPSDESRAYNFLMVLGGAISRLDDLTRSELLRLFQTGTSVVCGLCMKLFFTTGDADAATVVIDSGWKVTESEYEVERYWGSVVLSECGGKLPFSEIVSRVIPTILGYAVTCRGSRDDEIQTYGQVLHRIWRNVAGRHLIYEEPMTRAVVREDRVGSGRKLADWTIPDGGSEVRFVSPESVWGGADRHSSSGDLRHILDVHARERSRREVAVRLQDIVEQEREAGNSWFLHQFDRHAFPEVTARFPELVEQWLHAVEHGQPEAETLLIRCRGFYEALCDTLLEQQPEEGVKLFRHLRGHDEFRSVDRLTNIPTLLFAPFAVTDSPPVDALRSELLESCTTDADLLTVAFLAQFYRRMDWLRGRIDDWVISVRRYDQGRALMLLSFTDAVDAGERLQAQVAAVPECWRHRCAAAAHGLHQRNQWAREWLSTFWTHDDDVRAWTAFRLFLRCVDRRVWLWCDEMAKRCGMEGQRRAHFVANRSSICRAVKRNEEQVLKLHKTLLRMEVKDGQVWPWMGEFLDEESVVS